MQPNRDAMRTAAEAGFSTATDLADYLVRKGLPFRDAHAVVGSAVALAIERGQALADLDLAEFKQLSAHIDEDVYGVLSVEGSVAARSHFGGTAPSAVRRALDAAEQRIGDDQAASGQKM